MYLVFTNFLYCCSCYIYMCVCKRQLVTVSTNEQIKNEWRQLLFCTKTQQQINSVFVRFFFSPLLPFTIYRTKIVFGEHFFKVRKFYYNNKKMYMSLQKARPFRLVIKMQIKYLKLLLG